MVDELGEFAVHFVHRNHIFRILADRVIQRFVIGGTPNGGPVIPHELPAHETPIFRGKTDDITRVPCVSAHRVLRAAPVVHKRALACFINLQADDAGVGIQKAPDPFRRHRILDVGIVRLSLQCNRDARRLSRTKEAVSVSEVVSACRAEMNGRTGSYLVIKKLPAPHHDCLLVPESFGSHFGGRASRRHEDEKGMRG